jgi:hypothetical protein
MFRKFSKQHTTLGQQHVQKSSVNLGKRTNNGQTIKLKMTPGQTYRFLAETWAYIKMLNYASKR